MIPNELREQIIRPVLKSMDMWSEEAEDLLLGTAIHESDGLKRITQYGSGPALSYYQMEPATLHDLYENYLKYQPEKQKLLDKFKAPGLAQADNLRMNVAYATAAARLHYYRSPHIIPKSLEAQAVMWKDVYNTHLGKGTTEQYIEHVKDFVR